MRLYNINGRLISKNVSKYRIKWDKKSRSKIQTKVKKFIQPYWENHVVYEEFPVFGSKMKVDLFNATRKVAIEVQGSQHSSYNPFFHKGSRQEYLNSIKRDHLKFLWLEKNGYELIEVEEEEVKKLSTDFILRNRIYFL